MTPRNLETPLDDDSTPQQNMTDISASTAGMDEMASVEEEEDDDEEFVPDEEADEDEDDDEQQQNLEWLKEQWSGNLDSWYKHDEEYWEAKESVDDDMAGGDSNLQQCDVKESIEFLDVMKNNEPEFEKATTTRALDVGAGIGRITKNVLLPSGFTTVDLLERNGNFLHTAEQSLKENNQGALYYKCNLHEFPLEKFAAAHPVLQGEVKPLYDVIWCQWFCMFLTDDHLVQLLSTLKQLLKPHGVIVVKESVSWRLEVDKSDHSTTRTIELYNKIFEQVPGMYVVHSCEQKEFPDDYFAVQFWALRQEESAVTA